MLSDMYKILLIVLFPVLLLQAQSKKVIPVDTSYTIYSTFSKLIKEYPYIIPVEAKLPANVKALYNITYKSYPLNKRELKLDLFNPSDIKEKLPLIIFIHGGGWSSGSKEMEWYSAMYLASKGYITAAVEYSLSPATLYPAALYDILAAAEMLIRNDSYNIDSTNVILLGESAGGHLASLAGTNFNNGFRYRAIINIDGVMDLTTPSESGKDTIAGKPSAVKKWLGYSFKDKPELWKEASPLNYISKESPPFLFINSAVPRFHAGRDETIKKLNEYGIFSEVYNLEETPHSFWLFHPWIDATLDIVDRFLKKVIAVN